jgi:hypothetical protein
LPEGKSLDFGVLLKIKTHSLKESMSDKPGNGAGAKFVPKERSSKPDFRGLPHESVEEFLRRGGEIKKIPTFALRDVIKKLRAEFKISGYPPD